MRDEYNYKVAIINYAKEKGVIKSDEEIKFNFTNGYTGLEDMTFPHWNISIPSLNVSKEFNDQVRYGRRFGQDYFMDVPANRKIAYDWVDSLVKK